MKISQKIIHLIVWAFDPLFIIVVGDNRKLAKEAIYKVLKKIKSVKKSEGDINKSIFSFLFGFSKKNLIGEWATGNSNETKNLLEFIQPKIVVVADSQNKDPEEKFSTSCGAGIKEKARLAENLSTMDFVIINFDDKEAMAIKEKTRAKIITFGFGNEKDQSENNQKPDIQILNFEEKYDNKKVTGIVFKLEYSGSFVPVVIDNVFGKNYAYATAIGVVLGIICGLNLVEAAEQIDGAFV